MKDTRINEKKRKGRVKIIILCLLLLIITIISIVTITLKIEKVNVVGNTRYTAKEIEDIIYEDKFDRYVIINYIKSFFNEPKTIPFIEEYSIKYDSSDEVTITVYEKVVAGYVKYLGKYMYFDKDGIVVESSATQIEGVPEITGLEYDYIVLYSKIPIENTDAYQLILDVTQMIKKYSLTIDKVNISKDLEVRVYIDDVKVELGKSDNMNEKIADLNDLYANLAGKSGTLNMKEYNENKTGYIMTTN